MNSFRIASVITAALIGTSAFAAPPLALPGHAWAVLSSPMSVAEEGNTGLTVSAEQGADWFVFGNENRWKFNTYVNGTVVKDNGGYDWNNKGVAAVGMRVSRRLGSDSVVDFGIEAQSERRWQSGTTASGIRAYVQMWSSWDLKGK